MSGSAGLPACFPAVENSGHGGDAITPPPQSADHFSWRELGDVALHGREPDDPPRRARVGIPLDADHLEAELVRGYVPPTGPGEQVDRSGHRSVPCRSPAVRSATFAAPSLSNTRQRARRQ